MTDKDQNDQIQGVNKPYPTNDVRATAYRFLQNERAVVSVVLAALVAFSMLDFLEDRSAGASGKDLINDLSDALLPLGLLLYIWRFRPMYLKKKTSQLESNLAVKNADLVHWKAKANQYIVGLAEIINQQLDDWQLSRAEKEVAMLLLKGFSLRELAKLRGTSERTVRQQATHVYEKAGLSGRAELSAFFLEDLMLPSEIDT